MSNENNRIIKPSNDEVEAVRKMQHTATISLAVILGQMWIEHKKVDAEDKPVEFAISLRGLVPDAGKEKIAMFRAEAMWMQKVNGEEKVFHAHGPAFGAAELNKGINVSGMFQALAEGVTAKQKEIESGL